MQIEILQAGLRSKIIEAVKLSAVYRYDEAIELAEEYIRTAEWEKDNAKEAAKICELLYRQHTEADGVFYKRAQASAELGLTIDTIRNWEMNGLLKVKRKKNGYRIYDSDDINRLKIIRLLRCANYSLSAILRMLNALEYRINKSRTDILKALNTPDENEDIISVCDRLVFSLEKAEENARDVICLINEIKALTENEKS